MAVDRDAAEGLEVLEGDEGEVEINRHRDCGRLILETRIMDVKQAVPVTVPPDAPVSKAVELMQKRKVSAVMVVERKKGRRLTGIFTDRDLVTRAFGVRGFASAPVSRFMTPAPETLRPQDSVAYALNKMSAGRFRHVPLVDDEGRPAGMISIRDIADFIVELFPEEILNLPSEPRLAIHPTPDGD
jgi:CBS domain-containing protein